MPLTAKRLVKLSKRPGRYHDGHGLYLQVAGPDNVSWLLRFQRHGRERWAGLGPAWLVTLAEARVRAKAMRLQLLDGIDPLEAKRAAKAAAKLADVRRMTFTEAMKAYHQQHRASWRSLKHAQQWLASLEAHALPVLGSMDVATIARPDILRVIEPIWQTRTVTADRVRNRIEAILDWCTVRGHRPEGTNPAAWTGFLDQVLPAVKKVARPEHFPALPYAELPAFMAKLRQQQGVAPMALQFLILTASRTGEVLGARWDEINFGNQTWTVSAKRMKADREHQVPLAPAAIDLLRALPREDNNPFVFIGTKAGSGLGLSALSRVLKRMGGYDGITIHGFRSAFSDWANQETNHPNHAIELALAHAVGNETEKAYRRGPMLAKRVRLMADWAKFATSKPVVKADNVLTMLHGAR
jgi:integrase